jgi:hypothetical protein
VVWRPASWELGGRHPRLTALLGLGAFGGGLLGLASTPPIPSHRSPCVRRATRLVGTNF